MNGRALVIAAAILGAIAGVKLWESHLIAKGDAQGATREGHCSALPYEDSGRPARQRLSMMTPGVRSRPTPRPAA